MRSFERDSGRGLVLRLEQCINNSRERMKQTILTVLLTLSVTFGAFYGAAQAGLLDSMLNSDLPEVATTANYEISTYGWDSRVDRKSVV